MTALPTTPKFIEYGNAYLPKNHFIKEEIMQAEDDLALIFPFDKPDVARRHGAETLRNIQNDRAEAAVGYPDNQFCGPKCKNRYNVYKSQKKNTPDREAQNED